MAEQTEIKKTISIDLGNTTTSLKDYKKHIDELRGSLLQLDESSEEYAKICEEIKKEQDNLNKVMSVGKKDTDAAEGSYNHLVNTMAALKKEWRATADESKRADLGKQIKEINDKLKGLDAGTGSFQRNVGNYEAAFSKAMSSLANGIKSGATPAVGGLSAAFKALIANPIGAVIAAIVLVVKQLTDAIKGNEESTNSLKKSFALFQPVIDGIKNAFDFLAKGVVEAFDLITKAITKTLEGVSAALSWLGLDDMAGAIDGYLDKAEQAVNLSQQEADLTKQKRENTKKEAELQLEISELRAKMADKDKYNAKERAQFADEWEKKEKELAKIRYDEAQKEYKLIVEKNKLTANSAEDNEAEAQAYAKMINEQTKYNEQLRNITKEKQRLTGETERLTNATLKNASETKNEANSLQKAADEIEERLRKSNQTQIEILTEKFNEEKSILEKAGRDTQELVAQYEEQKTDIVKKESEKRQGLLANEVNDEINWLKKKAEQETFEVDYDETITTESEKAARIFEIQQEFTNNIIGLKEAELEMFMGTEEQKKALIEEIAVFKQKAANDEMKYTKQAAELERKEAEKTKKIKEQTLMSSLSVASNVFGAMSDLAEEGSEEQKAFSVMQTTIDTLSGAIAAYKSMAGIPYVGPFLGAAAAAAVGVAGGINIKKILSTKPNSGGSTDVATPNIQTPSMTSVSPLLNEQEDINRMTSLQEQGDSSKQQQNLRVYVVDQDIRDANARAEVVEDNVTF